MASPSTAFQVFPIDPACRHIHCGAARIFSSCFTFPTYLSSLLSYSCGIAKVQRDHAYNFSFAYCNTNQANRRERRSLGFGRLKGADKKMPLLKQEEKRYFNQRPPVTRRPLIGFYDSIFMVAICSFVIPFLFP